MEPDTRKPNKTDKKKVFIAIDNLNNEKMAEGSINSTPYAFERGKPVTVDAQLAAHLLAVGQAIEM